MAADRVAQDGQIVGSILLLFTGMCQVSASGIVESSMTNPMASLDDLQAFTVHRAHEVPSLAQRIVLRSPGITPEERERLIEGLPGLPDSYVECAVRFSLERVELGHAVLRPGSFGGHSLVARLIAANSRANPLTPLYQANRLFEVARWEAEPICVVGEGGERSGEVVLVDLYAESAPLIMRCAPDFPTFMIAAGRVCWALTKEARLDDLLDDIELDGDQRETWSAIVSTEIE